MSTRAAVGILAGGHFTGTYVHSDGYPGHLAWQLAMLIERDGVGTALATITSQNSWSCLDAVTDHPEWVHGGMELVSGYGVAHGRDALTADDVVDFDLDGGGDTWGCEWAYALSDGDLAVIRLHWSGETRTLVERIPLSELATDRKVWQRLEDRIQAS